MLVEIIDDVLGCSMSLAKRMLVDFLNCWCWSS